MDEETKSAETNIDVIDPIIINMGKQKRKRIKNLMKGRGRLWLELEEVIEEVGDVLGDELDGKAVLPIVLIYRRKPKRKKLRGMFGL